jgi:hypothetical protein
MQVGIVAQEMLQEAIIRAVKAADGLAGFSVFHRLKSSGLCQRLQRLGQAIIQAHLP